MWIPCGFSRKSLSLRCWTHSPHKASDLENFTQTPRTRSWTRVQWSKIQVIEDDRSSKNEKDLRSFLHQSSGRPVALRSDRVQNARSDRFAPASLPRRRRSVSAPPGSAGCLTTAPAADQTPTGRRRGAGCERRERETPEDGEGTMSSEKHML